MGFLTPALLAGSALIAIPIVLHLVMRRQPRMLTFPALRFVKAGRDANRRKLQLRHLLLLALRCLLIAGLAASLARPTLKGAGLRGKEGAPLAIAVVVDNSLRMQYVHQNRTRLEGAAEAAAELVAKLPEDSAVAICDLGRAASGFAPDLNAAGSRLRNLRTTPAARPLAAVMVEAIKLTAERDDHRQEVFVFSDLAATAWTDEAMKGVEAALAEAPDVQLYMVDCGSAAARNRSIGELEIPRSVIRAGESLRIETSVLSDIAGADPLVELHLQNEEGRLEKSDQRIAVKTPDGSADALFEIANLPLGTQQGSVKLTASDPLAMDDTRYFTVEVRPPARVLLLAERPADARYVREALSPSLAGAASRFQCDVRTFAEVAEAPLDDYQAVLLLDPTPLADEAWNRLKEYVSSGGGVGLFLGHHAVGQLPAFNGEAAQRLLPGKLKRVSRNETYLRPRRLDHPALAGLRQFAEGIPWPVCRVFMYWQFEDASENDAYTVAGFANEEPAILERPAGRGRLITVATPFSDPPLPEGREPWNAFTQPDVAWPFLAICDHLVGYLAQDADEQLNYLAGETARLRLGPQQQIDKFVLRMPDGHAESRIAATGDNELSVGVTEMLGNYQLTAGGRSQRLDRGFSVNAAPELSELARIEPDAIAAALPKDRVRMVDAVEDIEEYVDVGRTGRELYPWMIGLVVLVWSAEHVLANRFYREAGKGAG